MRASASINVTAVRDAAGVERRHLAESLRLLMMLEDAELLPDGAAVIDIGSGGGLPGVPLAIVRPDLRVTLLEATGKKAAFLQGVVEALNLTGVRVLTARAESAAHETAERERYDLAVARAVAPLAALAELTLPFVRIDGALAAVKSARAEEEIVQAAGAIRRCGGGAARLIQSSTGEDAVRVVLIAKLSPTPAELPRRPGMPQKRPLQ